MLFVREFTVRKHERGLLFKNGDFVRFLAPATYRFFDPLRRVDVERFDLSQPAFEHRLVDYLVRWQPEAIEDLFVRVETGTNQIAVITKNGHPWSVVGPERRALFWKGVIHVKAELIDISADLSVAPRIARTIAADLHARRSSVFEHAVLVREVPEAHTGLLYVDGALIRELAPGLHAFWKLDRSVTVELCDRRLKTLEVCGQEILTKDNVSVGITVSATYRIGDAKVAARTLREPQNFLHRQVQATLRTAVGARSLDALLENPAAIGDAVFTRLHDWVAALGIELGDVHVKDVQLLEDHFAPQHLGVLNELVRIKL